VSTSDAHMTPLSSRHSSSNADPYIGE
jgi:hypothetical protein